MDVKTLNAATESAKRLTDNFTSTLNFYNRELDKSNEQISLVLSCIENIVRELDMDKPGYDFEYGELLEMRNGIIDALKNHMSLLLGSLRRK